MTPKTWTVEDIRHRFPKMTEAQLEGVVALLNRPRATLRQIWAGEDQMPAEPVATGPDGLTDAMREVNRFAEENALRIPFPPKR